MQVPRPARARVLRATTPKVSGFEGADLIKTCRICWGDEHLDDKLVSPCQCSGSMKYVHLTCLCQWQAQLSAQKGLVAARRCDVCKAKWQREFRDLSEPSKGLWAKFVFALHYMKPGVSTLVEWWKAVIVVRGVLTALEVGAAGFQVGLKWRDMGLREQRDLFSVLQWIPLSVWATGAVSPLSQVPAMMLIYLAARGAQAVQTTLMAIAGMYAGSVAGFASGVGNTLLNSLHFIGSVTLAGAATAQTLFHTAFQFFLKFVPI